MSEERHKGLTLEELMEIAASEIDPRERAGDLNEGQRFCIAFGLHEGEIRNKVAVVYDAYAKWSKKPLHRNIFGKQMTKLFPIARTGVGRYYLMNRKITNE